MSDSVVFQLPSQVGLDFVGEMVAIHRGLLTGIYPLADWNSIKWLVKSKAAARLDPKYNEFRDWNQAVCYVNTANQPLVEANLSKSLLAAPTPHIRSEHVFSGLPELPLGTILIAPPGSVIIPYTGPIINPPTVQVVIKRFGEDHESASPLLKQSTGLASQIADDNRMLIPDIFGSFASQPTSTRNSPIPFLMPERSLQDETPATPSTGTLASTPPPSPSWSPSPIFKGGLRAAAALTVPRPLRRSYSTNAFFQRIPSAIQFATPALSPTISGPANRAEIDHRLKVVDAMRQLDPASELEILGGMIVQMLSTDRISQEWRHEIVQAASSAGTGM
ncbi:hypothetical protein CTheo_8401 [Ceratobasidium theobromae]|uniref:Uncharacterized protein n=1 Tax=Ceratobasidium theobromae TaxID=1582974 RepID=A0A5N5Q8V5_9AGAM|nr:hypothetical protein CTheo_8401 [Ceratobasidium theobromae]